MPAPLLTSLAQVKAWLGIASDSTSSDAILTRLISSVSRFLYQKIDLNTVLPTDYSELRDGYGHSWIRPYNWPLLSLTSVVFGSNTLTTASTGSPPNNGWTLNPPSSGFGPTRIKLHGYVFPHGKDLIVLNYRAGFQETEELTIYEVLNTADPPVAVAWTVDLSDLFAADLGVTYDGVRNFDPLTKVSSNPALGEYTVTAAGVYGFNAGDTGHGVLVTYSYVPSDLAQAAVELIAGTFKEKEHIGVKLKTLAGQETIAYFQNQITPGIALLINPYLRVTPS